VTTMQGMFCCAQTFNQPLDSWDVRNVTTVREIFFGADAFCQPLSGWCIYIGVDAHKARAE